MQSYIITSRIKFFNPLKLSFKTKLKLNFGFKPKLIQTIQFETGFQALEYTTIDSKISKTKKQALEAIQSFVWVTKLPESGSLFALNTGLRYVR